MWPTRTANPCDEASSGALRRVLTVAAPLLVLIAAVAIGLPLCPSAFVLHIPCPGCGLGRATMALLHGDLATASAMQPAWFVVLPLLGAPLGWVAVQYVATGRSAPPRWALVAIVASFVTLVAVWAARLLGAFGGPVPV
jgi:hypothetical protein